jgi:uncharacterized protein YjbI with pentapeptide repeats
VLRRANFYRANLDGAELVEADLHSAKLDKCSLLETSFRGSSLYKTSLRDSVGDRCDFTGAKIEHAIRSTR